MNNIRNTKGISLVVLIITVVIMAILLGAVILEITDSNVETRAEEAAFKQSVSTFKDELDLYLNQRKLDAASNGEIFKPNLYNSASSFTKTIVKSSVGTSFEGKLRVVNGELKLVDNSGFTEEEIQWFNEVN